MKILKVISLLIITALLLPCLASCDIEAVYDLKDELISDLADIYDEKNSDDQSDAASENASTDISDTSDDTSDDASDDVSETPDRVFSVSEITQYADDENYIVNISNSSYGILVKFRDSKSEFELGVFQSEESAKEFFAEQVEKYTSYVVADCRITSSYTTDDYCRLSFTGRNDGSILITSRVENTVLLCSAEPEKEEYLMSFVKHIGYSAE